MTDDEQAIRELIEGWARAVHEGDLGGVLAEVAEDIVMFDVPPPQDGVRGIDAYARTWPGFFSWQASGARFEIVSLDVMAGGDVAFAHALLRCGTAEELAASPGTRLRLTLGLRRQAGRWVVAHEHHSFPDTTDPAGDGAAVRAVHEQWSAGTTAKDLDAIMASVADDVVSYEHAGRLRHVGLEQVREVCRIGLDASPGPCDWTIPDLTVVVGGDLAVAWGLDRIRTRDSGGVLVESWSRGTRVFRREGGRWVLAHQHVSYPLDPDTGQARTDLVPGPPGR